MRTTRIVKEGRNQVKVLIVNVVFGKKVYSGVMFAPFSGTAAAGEFFCEILESAPLRLGPIELGSSLRAWFCLRELS